MVGAVVERIGQGDTDSGVARAEGEMAVVWYLRTKLIAVSD